jgi:hypothetical protein
MQSGRNWYKRKRNWFLQRGINCYLRNRNWIVDRTEGVLNKYKLDYSERNNCYFINRNWIIKEDECDNK